jgi:undecaprenyl-diphosphatase UppP
VDKNRGGLDTAGIIGVLFEDKIDELFFNPWTVAITLILYGILFILIEKRNKNRTPRIESLEAITYKTALIIGVFQALALIPGTSRSGATIVGAILIGTQRKTAAEFTFFLAVPAMAAASLFKLVKFGFSFSVAEAVTLALGSAVAFAVSVVAIKFLVGYIKKHDFKVFGWYALPGHGGNCLLCRESPRLSGLSRRVPESLRRLRFLCGMKRKEKIGKKTNTIHAMGIFIVTIP